MIIQKKAISQKYTLKWLFVRECSIFFISKPAYTIITSYIFILFLEFSILQRLFNAVRQLDIVEY